MGKWEMVRLGDVCNFINGDRGVNYPSAKDFCKSGVPFINAGHLENDAVAFDSMNYISELKYSQLGSGKVQNGDLLYCLRGSLGKQAVVRGIENGAIASSLVIIRPHNINIDYLRYCMKSREVYEQQLKANNGSSQPNLSAASVKKYTIPLPSLPTQQKIADVLDRANALVEKRKAQIDKLDLLVKSQFIEMFGDPVTNPMGWEVKQLGDECIIITGNTPPRIDKDNYGDYLEWIKSDNINTPDSYLTRATEYISEQGFGKCRYVDKDCILMTCIAGSISCIGNIAISDRRVAFNQQINAIVPNNNHHLFMYWMLLLSKPYIQSTVNMALKGILSKSRLSELDFIFPPRNYQEKFATFVERVEAQKSQIKKSLALLELNYKSLMQKCFRGEMS